MKASIHNTYGPPEVQHITDVTAPSPKSDEILIRVHYSTVNRTDCGFRAAKPFVTRFFSGLIRPKHAILGCEFAGEVVEIGDAVSEYSVGDRVFGFDDQTWGGHAELKTIKAQGMVTKIPTNISYKQAAPGLEGAHYMLFYLRAANITKGSKVLINGASGAIGSSAVQIMSHIGADITAVCGTKNVEFVESLGANKVIDYQKEDFTKLEDKFDVVFDSVGKSSFAACKPILKPNGIYTSSELGNFAQNPFLVPWTKFFSKQKVLFPIPSNRPDDVKYIATLIGEGAFLPVIDREYELDEIVEATKYVETGQKTGNVVIKII